MEATPNDHKLMICRNQHCAVVVFKQWRQLCPACTRRGITIKVDDMSTVQLASALESST